MARSRTVVIMYLFIGLILLLAVYLVRGRRARANAATETLSPGTPTGGRASIRSPKKRKNSAAPPSPAPAVVAPEPFGPAVGALPAEPTPLPRPAPSIVERAPDWTPEDPIVEPGWPLPGEISGGWSPAPEPAGATPFLSGANADPAPVVEWAPSGVPGEPVEAVAEAGEPAPADAGPQEQSGPPLWVPGDPVAETSPASEIETAGAEPIWLGEPVRDEKTALEEAAVAVWQPDAPSFEEAPPLDWAPDETESEDEQPIWLADPGAEDPGASNGGSPNGVPSPSAFAWTVETGPGADPAAGPPDAEPEPEPPSADAFPAWSEPAVVTQPEYVEVDLEIAAEVPLREQSAAVAGLVPALLDGLVPFTRVCDRLGVTPRMLALMRTVDETPLSVTELARHLGVSRPLVAELCTRLENLGFARREPLETDRRRVRVVLTEAGRKVYADSIAVPEPKAVEAVLSGLSAGERAQLLTGLQALANPPA